MVGGVGDTFGSIGRDNVGDVANTGIIEVKVAEVRLACVDQDAAKLNDGLAVRALSQGLHSRLHQVELLLQVVEADLCIDTVPVEEFVLDEGGLDEAAVDAFLVQNVEQGLEENYKQGKKQRANVSYSLNKQANVW